MVDDVRAKAVLRPIDVVISVDTEFAINSALIDPRRTPIGRDYIDANDGTTSHGLGFMLRTLAEHQLRATFFIECFNVFHFGEEPMASVAKDIADHGHDLQIHLHLVWLYYRLESWRRRLEHESRPEDRFAGWDPGEVQGWVSEAVAIFRRLTGRQAIAFRSGNLSVDLNLYRALAAANIALASNVGLALFRPQEPELQLSGGIHRFSGVVEVPVTSYADFFRQQPNRLLTTTGSTWREIAAVLESAWRKQAGPVVILTHPHDFGRLEIAADGSGFRARPAVLQQQRFVELCRLLGRARDRFRTSTFDEAAERWAQAGTENDRLLHASFSGFTARAVENRLQPRLAGLRRLLSA